MPTAPCNLICEGANCPDGKPGCVFNILEGCGDDPRCIAPPSGGGGDAFAMATAEAKRTPAEQLAEFIATNPLAESTRRELAKALAFHRVTIRKAGQ